jgi:hypothetical protein
MATPVPPPGSPKKDRRLAVLSMYASLGCRGDRQPLPARTRGSSSRSSGCERECNGEGGVLRHPQTFISRRITVKRAARLCSVAASSVEAPGSFNDKRGRPNGRPRGERWRSTATGSCEQPEGVCCLGSRRIARQIGHQTRESGPAFRRHSYAVCLMMLGAVPHFLHPPRHTFRFPRNGAPRCAPTPAPVVPGPPPGPLPPNPTSTSCSSFRRLSVTSSLSVLEVHGLFTFSRKFSNTFQYHMA